jgi:DNA-binding GntR family transcriptional regulator
MFDTINADSGESRTDRAYHLLRTEILRAGLAPGERLRAADLENRYQLGLTPIREALTRLAAESLVESETHRGARVSEVSAAGLADLMSTLRDVERLCLLPSLERGDAAWEAEIVTSMHLLARTPGPSGPDDWEAASRWDAQHRRFHAALVAACGSEWLLRFWNMLLDGCERYHKVCLLQHRTPLAEERDRGAEHTAITEAVLARDAGRAVALLDEHVRRTERWIAGSLETPAVTMRASQRSGAPCVGAPVAQRALAPQLRSQRL